MPKSKRILLVEPAYQNKYPPIGLMKIATYHKLKGDTVCFVKGCCNEIRRQKWDQIYITTLFSFYWLSTIYGLRCLIELALLNNVDVPFELETFYQIC